MKKQHVELSRADREYLKSLLSKGKMKDKIYKRAMGLLELDRGKTLQETARTLRVNYNTIAAWRNNYQREGIKCLEDKPRSGRPIEIDRKQRVKIAALARSKVPAGRAHWDLRSLAEKVVELGYCKKISHTQVSKIIKKRV